MAAGTTTLLCVDATKDPCDAPTTPEPDHPDVQADHPGDRPEQGITYQTTGADPPAPPAGTPAIPRAKALPAVLPLISQTDLPDVTGDQPPSGTTRIALR